MAGGGERRAPATGVFIALVAAAVGTWTPPAPAQESIPQAVHRIDGTVRELGRQSREMDRKSREMDRKLQELDRKLREVDRTARDLSRRLGELERAGSGGSGQESSGEAVETGLGLTREDRRRIQRALTAQGYQPGSPDGQFGRRTRTAIAEWQAARGAKPTGFLGADGVKILLAAAPEVERGRSVGERIRDCAQCPELVVVPAGSFMMGSRSTESGRDGDEGPVHRVTIREPFAVGVYEVTFAQWDACRRDRGCTHNPGDRSWGRGTRPVISVSWGDARRYVQWLSRKTGKRYRLLSESEWEYVARAGTKTPFHYGPTISTAQANYNGSFTYGSGRKGRYRKRTVPVGSFPANAFGLHDVHGNVEEWVADCWHGGYAGAPSDGSRWVRGGNCRHRVYRGGSWLYVPASLRSANRSSGEVVYRGITVGFRVARTLD